MKIDIEISLINFEEIIVMEINEFIVFYDMIIEIEVRILFDFEIEFIF